YKLSYGTQSGVYTTTLDVGNVTSKVLTQLTGGTRYYFAVQAYNTSGVTGPFSTEVPFDVPASTPTKTTPAHGAGPAAGNFNFNWQTMSAATGYEICVQQTPGGTCTAGWMAVGNTTSAVVSAPAVGAGYYWQVRAITATGPQEADSGTWWVFWA